MPAGSPLPAIFIDFGTTYYVIEITWLANNFGGCLQRRPSPQNGEFASCSFLFPFLGFAHSPNASADIHA
jgi:hypothetical protein